MKKILGVLIVVMFVAMLPFASFAKTAVSESELDAITAQEGVTLDFGSSTGSYTGATVMVTNFAPSLFSWGDSNGFGSTYTSYGWVGASNISMGAAASILVYNAMTLDVGSSGTVTKLNIGLPSVMVHPVTTDATLKLGTSKQLTDNQILGTFYNDQFAVIVSPFNAYGYQSSLTIGNHSATNQQGVEMTFNNFYLYIPGVAIDASWGDADGFTGYTSPGYIGLQDYVTAASNGTYTQMLVNLSGTSSIDVGTSGTLTKLSVVLPTTTINSGFATLGMPIVNITANVTLADNKQLSGSQPILGTLYMEGLHPTTAGSFCLFAH